MRIIKGDFEYEQLIQIIAGEMINIEASVLHYIDGKPRPVTPTMADYDGYPRIVDGPTYTIKAARGFVYLPKGLYADLNEVINDIMAAVLKLAESFTRLDGKPAQLLTGYQYMGGISARIKAKSSITGTYILSAGHVASQRLLVPITYKTSTYATFCGNRFTWYIGYTEHIDLVIRENIDDHITLMCNSILYDKNNSIALAHNSICFDLKPFLNTANTTDVVLPLVMGNPLVIRKLNPKLACCGGWQRLPTGDAFEIDLKNIDVRSDSGEYICAVCDEKLYDSNYVIEETKTSLQYACCALCAHSTNNMLSRGEKNCNIYVAKFPDTIEDYIRDKTAKMKASLAMQYRAAMTAANMGIAAHTTPNGIRDIKYWFIGDTHVMFKSLRKYLFAGAEVHRAVAGRSVIFGTVFIPIDTHLYSCPDQMVATLDY